MIRRPCASAGCGRPVEPPRRYCSDHEPLEAARLKRQADRAASQRWEAHHGGNPEWQAMLHSSTWRKVRAAYLKDHPLCACGCGGMATTVDHLRPGDLAEAFNPDFLQGLTLRCHNRKSAHDAHAARRGGK
jgi:5-methylcytosine-specific restriction enzyme A